MAMNPSIYRISSFLRAWFGLGMLWLASCSSVDEVPRGGRVEHPTEPHPLVAPSTSVASTPSPIAAAKGSATPSQEAPPRRRTPSEVYEESTGIKLSEADKAIMDDCPSHALSKNVPKRACTKDEQCGDGFCDRGRCAAIWTCTVEYGQRCDEEQKCGVHYLCRDGRCQSCAADSECKSYPNNSDPKCVPDPFYVPSSKQCRGWVGSVVPEYRPITPGPSPSK